MCWPQFLGEEYWYCCTWLEFERVHQVVLDTLQEKREDGWNCTCIYTAYEKHVRIWSALLGGAFFFFFFTFFSFLLLSFLYLSRTSERCSVSLCGDGVSVPGDLQYHTHTLHRHMHELCVRPQIKIPGGWPLTTHPTDRWSSAHQHLSADAPPWTSLV